MKTDHDKVWSGWKIGALLCCLPWLWSADSTPVSPGYEGEHISLDFQGIDVRAALQMLAEVNDFSLVVSDAVRGELNLRLIDVPWDQALEVVLQAQGLDRRMNGRVMMVAPAEDIGRMAQQQLDNARQSEAIAPLKTVYLRVNYASASDLQRLIRGESGASDRPVPGPEGEGNSQGSARRQAGPGLLSTRGSMAVDQRTNTLIVRDTDEAVAEVLALVERLDVPVKQVLIEARIVNASTSFSRGLGVRWGGVHEFSRAGDQVLFGGSLPTTVEQAELAAAFDRAVAQAVLDGLSPEEALMTTPLQRVSFPEALAVDLAVPAATTTFALGLAAAGGLLELELSALEASGEGEIIAQPHITTQDKQKALIQSGMQVPYQAQAGGTAGGSVTQFIPAVLKLEVTPQITPDGRIIMDLLVNQDTVMNGGDSMPAIATNAASARVLVDDGATLVLGGVFRDEVSQRIEQTPVLGDLPLLGALFRRTARHESKTELLIFITPSILDELM